MITGDGWSVLSTRFSDKFNRPDREVCLLSLDAIIISEYEQQSLSGSSPLRLQLDGRIADIQVVLNYISNNGKVVLPIDGDGVMSWSSAPKLNGIFLYSYLDSHNFNVALINNYASERNRFLSLLNQNPKAVIISTTFVHRKNDLIELVEDIRSLAPDIFVISGGPFIYLSYLILQKSGDDIYNTSEIQDDFVFLGRQNPRIDLLIISPRGEKILAEALKRIKTNKTTKDLPNSAYLDGGKYCFGPRTDDFEPGEHFNIEWDRLPEDFFSTGVIPMQASTGCPNKCAFCNFTKHPKLISLKQTKELISELEAVSLRGIEYVWFVDDNFRLGKTDLTKVCNDIIDVNPGIKWMSFIHVESLRNVDLELLYESGCKELRFGLESADPQILKNMNKKVDPLFASKIIKKLLALGINCSCYFLIGFPGETEETVIKTIDYIKSLEHPNLKGMFTWSIYPFMLAPLSPIYEYASRKKYALTGYMNKWTHQTMSSDQARKHVVKAFASLNKSGPIYRGDNLAMLEKLSSGQRKNFTIIRHNLSKLSLTTQLTENDIISSFRPILFP